MFVKKSFLNALLFASLISSTVQANEVAVGKIVEDRLSEIHKMPVNEQMKSFTELQTLLDAELLVIQKQAAISAESKKMNKTARDPVDDAAYQASMPPSSINLNQGGSERGGTFTEAPALPLVTGIEGARNQYWATFRWPDGSSQTITVGDKVKSFTVMEINNVRVRVKAKDGESVWISKTEPGLNSSTNAGGSISQPGMPGMPGMPY